MPDWDYINGMADEYGFGDPDMDCHDPAGHCGSPFGGSAGASKRTAYGPVVVCKHCGSRDVYWKNTVAGYRLYDRFSLSRHLCRQPEPPNAEGFDDVV